MKKLFTVFAMVFAVALFVGCAEEPVEEEMVTEEETLEPAPAVETDMGTEPMMDDTTMTDTAMMGDTVMTDTEMSGDTASTDTEMEN